MGEGWTPGESQQRKQALSNEEPVELERCSGPIRARGSNGKSVEKENTLRKMMLLAVIAAVVALMLAASPAMAKGNGAKEEKNETPRQQAQEENHFNHFNNFGFFPGQCVGLCNFGFENEFEPNFVGFDNGCWWNGCFNNSFPVFTSSFVDGNNCFCDDDFFRPRSCTPHQILDLNTNEWIWVSC
jgi:hypothetical protein